MLASILTMATVIAAQTNADLNTSVLVAGGLTFDQDVQRNNNVGTMRVVGSKATKAHATTLATMATHKPITMQMQALLTTAKPNHTPHPTHR